MDPINNAPTGDDQNPVDPTAPVEGGEFPASPEAPESTEGQV